MYCVLCGVDILMSPEMSRIGDVNVWTTPHVDVSQ